MIDLTEEQALEFAEAMGDTHPPTNVDLIDTHIDWWQENHPQHAPVIRNWYEQWQDKVNDEEINYKEYDEAYHEFMNMLNEIELF